ncbi:MAG: hypothetical protein J0L67_06220 [Cytophagales bacterium]|nr:hypothetical protein [Cytophagales bacterium]
MKRNFTSGLLLITVLLFQCSTTQKDSTVKVDTVVTVLPNQSNHDASESNSIDIGALTIQPFEPDFELIKSFLETNGIIFTLDTSYYKNILFDSSRIQFLESSRVPEPSVPELKERLGKDMISSSDIWSPKFRFNQGVSIGMPQAEFLKRSGLTESSIVQDKADYQYYENKVINNEYEWKITIWFKGEFVARIQSEIRN